MENDEPKNINLIISNNHTSASVFNLEYNDQNVNHNIEYQKWKKLMLIEYGDNSKQFKCNKDKILFYSSYNDYIKNYSYKSICPVCHNDICYFCSFNNNNYNLSCCIKNSILKAIFYSGPEFVKEPFDESTLLFLIPILSNFATILSFFKVLYICIIIEKYKNNNDEEYVQYIDLANKNKKYYLNFIIIILIGIFLSIPFIIIYNYFIILLIIISIPFKFVPLKYYLGVLYND